MKDFLLPIATFITGLVGGLLPHVQKPLTDYRATLAELSHTLIRNVILMYSDYKLQPEFEEDYKTKKALDEMYNTLRDLHARLLSSATTMPAFATPVLRFLGLVRSPTQINQGAQMLIGISNQIISGEKDRPHLTVLIKRLGTALSINVGQ